MNVCIHFTDDVVFIGMKYIMEIYIMYMNIYTYYVSI